MNIINKIGIAASLMAAAMMSSCSDKGYWDEAPAEQGYSFEAASYSANLAPGPNTLTFTLERSIANSEESVDVTFTPSPGCPSDISLASPVVFKAGSYTAEVTLSIADAQPPHTYSGTLNFNADKASYAGIAKCEFSYPVNYTWSSMGNGTFYDAFVMDGAEEPFSVEIMKTDGFERYRVMNPYAEYYTTIGPNFYDAGWIGSTGPAYIEFWENADGNLSFNSYNTGLNYEGNSEQPIGAYNWSAFAAGSYPSDQDIWYAEGFAVLSPIYYINGLGGFGQIQYAVQIELPK